MNMGLDKNNVGAFVLINGKAIFIDSKNKLGLKFDLSNKIIKKDTNVLQLTLKNEGKKEVTINSLVVADFYLSKFKLKEVLENGWSQSSFSGYRKIIKETKKRKVFMVRDQNPFSYRADYGHIKNSLISEWYTQIVGQKEALVIGAVTTSQQFSQIFLKNGNEIHIRVTCQLDGHILKPREKMVSEKIAFVISKKEESLVSFSDLIKNYNNIVLANTPPRGLCCSYYYHGSNVEENYIASQLSVLKNNPERFDIEYVQIDGGYCMIGDWLDSTKQFPKGMEHIIKEIKKHNLKAGIWIAPYVASPKSLLFKEHPDWFVKNKNGKYVEARLTTPIDFLPSLQLRALDPTNPEVAQYISSVVRQFVSWGFELIKVDFTYPVCFTPNYYKHQTRAQALHEAYKTIRKAAGARVHILSGITQLSPLVGLVDSARVGLDTLNPAVAKIPFLRRFINENMLKQNLRSSSARQFLNGKIWFNDADCLVARPYTGLSKKLVEEHVTFLKTYRGSLWLGDHLELLPKKRYNQFLYDIFGLMSVNKKQ